MISRRDFVVAVGAGLSLAPFAVNAQPAGEVWRIGVLEPYGAQDPINDQIRQALKTSGLTEGKNIAIEWRHGEGETARFAVLAGELARFGPNAIIAIGDPAIRAARQAAPGIPIVAGSDDLVGEGSVASLSYPGGSVTGVSILASELNAKRLEVLKEAIPSASKVFVLWDPATGRFHLTALEAVAHRLGVALNIAEIHGPEDLDRAFEAARAWRAEALNVLASPLLHALREPIIDRAARYRLPAIYQWGESALAGGLMAYGPTHREVFQEMAVQLGRVLKGARPADLPVEQPTKFELVINRKTARALGITIPEPVLARADRVIE